MSYPRHHFGQSTHSGRKFCQNTRVPLPRSNPCPVLSAEGIMPTSDPLLDESVYMFASIATQRAEENKPWS